MLQILGMLEGSGYEKTGFGSAASISYVAEAMQRFYADRSEYFGDPDFFKVPITGLLDPAYIQKRRATIDRDHATPSDQVKPGKPAGSESTRDDALLRRRRRRQRRRRYLHFERRLRKRHHRSRPRISAE